MSATITHLRVARAAPPAALLPMGVHAYMQTILEASTALMRAGHEIVAFYAEVVTTMPVIWIRDTPAVRALIDCGEAAYDMSGIDDRGPYRVGMFLIEGVRVQWFERVPA
jgi:hypothetical protein